MCSRTHFSVRARHSSTEVSSTLCAHLNNILNLVIGTGSELMCKHILGTRIADAMGILSPRYADAQTLKDIFSSKVDLKDPQLESEVSSKSFAISRMLDDSIEEHLEPVDTEDLENLAPMSSLSD